MMVPANPVPEVVRRLPAMNYLDLSASWVLDKRFSLRGGISNALDRDPPLFAGAAPQGNGNTWVGTYDVLGRRIWATLTATF
jgi:outer membrane receptor protein involved in Fe transport